MKKSASEKSITTVPSVTARTSVTPKRLFRNKTELEQSVNRLHNGQSIRDSSKTGALYRTFKHDRTKTKILKSGTDFASRVQQLSKANERNHLSLADQCLMFQKEDIRW